MQIDLLIFNADRQTLEKWPLGQMHLLPERLQDLTNFLKFWLRDSPAPYCLFWDWRRGKPVPAFIKKTTKLPGDLWHAGFRLGTSGLPRLIDFVDPVSMLNKDPCDTLTATSWRISLQACLLKTEVFRQLDILDSEYETLLAAGLDFGYRCIRRGVFIRHVPGLIPESVAIPNDDRELPIHDELRFLLKFFGRRWALWATVRAIMNGYSINGLMHTWKKLSMSLAPANSLPYQRQAPKMLFHKDKWHHKVTVLIPTLQRYAYLRRVLEQLRKQTITPLEIIAVDQTPVKERSFSLQEEFSDLPLKVLYLESAGQCTARNLGLQASAGDYILFLDDDDDELPPTLIEQHLKSLIAWQAEVSSGVAEEVGAGPLPANFTFLRISDVFPAGNTMIRRTMLKKIGLFDQAFDHGGQADHDLGMRCYLAGALMILNPEIRVLHHRASRGGLRNHRARVITYAASRSCLAKRRLTSSTEFYLMQKYYTPFQLRESVWLSTFGTFAIRGNKLKKLLKIFVSGLMLPHTLWKTHLNRKRAIRLHDHHNIPHLLPLSSPQ